MHLPPDIVTERLRLVAITPELLRGNARELGRRLQVEVPEAWPPEHWEPHVLDLLELQFLAEPVTVGWNRYIVVRGEAPTLIGAIGAFAKPQGEAEVGYSILEQWHGRGFATESLGALVRCIFASESVRVVSAHTYPRLVASVRVLSKCGFSHIGPGQEEGTVRYELNRAQFSGALSAPDGRG